jgi:hypothetical protein
MEKGEHRAIYPKEDEERNWLSRMLYEALDLTRDIREVKEANYSTLQHRLPSILKRLERINELVSRNPFASKKKRRKRNRTS